MRFFFDTEFIENGRKHPIEIISIGIIAEDGRSLYIERLDVPWELASDWVLENVKPQLNDFVAHHGHDTKIWLPVEQMGTAILDFVGYGIGSHTVEFWAYYADYDWVVLCGLFGSMMDLPAGWPMYCRDFKQRLDAMGNPALIPQPSPEHHALMDAAWLTGEYERLIGGLD